MRVFAAMLMSLPLLFLACQRDEVVRYRVPKGGRVEAPRAPGGLVWSLPKGWTEAPGDGMRVATLVAPVPGRLECTVVALGGQAGGELENVNRWRGQIGLGPVEEGAIPGFRKPLQTALGPLQVYEFRGEGTSHMVVGQLAGPDGRTWVLKLAGDPGPVGQALPGFMALLESLRPA